jgi:phosphatidylserine decarboxylase
MKNSTTTQLIAKEGWKYLFFISVLFVLSLWFNFFSWVFFVILIFTAYLFRNPERLPAEDDDMAILSPSDGTISTISKAKHIDGKEYIKVEIQKSLLEACILRSPTMMSLKSTNRRHGLFLPTTSSLSKKLGERVILKCKSSYSELFININAGVFARKIELFKTVGPLKSAQRFGLLVEGNIELYLPLDSRVKVAVGDEVKAGESVLGYFAHKGKIDER